MKETRLQEDAYIYDKRKNKAEKQKWKELSGAERWQYFKDYYLIKILAMLGALAFGLWLFSNILSPKNEIDLYVALINSSSTQEKEDEMMKSLAGLLECENLENVVLDSSYFMELEGMDQGSLGTIQKLSAQAYSQMLDIVIAGEEEFHYFAKQGYFMDMAEALPTDLYSRLSDRIYLDRIEEMEGEAVSYGETMAYGIYLEGLQRFEELGTGMKTPVIGIVANTQNQKSSVKALKYLTK